MKISLTTPLFIHHRPPPQTQLEALEQVITNLEDFVEKGIRIDPEIYASSLEICYRLQVIRLGIRLHRLIPTSLVRRNFGISSKLLMLYSACGIGFVRLGEELHCHVVCAGFVTDGFVLHALVDMYSKCGDIVKARKIFDKMPHRDLISYNSMLTTYVHHGLEIGAVNIFCQMILEGCEPNSVSISIILTSVSLLCLGIQIHGWVIWRGLEWNMSIANFLMVMYSSHGRLEKACWIFNLRGMLFCGIYNISMLQTLRKPCLFGGNGGS
ncbi:hypothetical protein LR48_Vigan11g172500 [Vigna angularis]|uniref:Pentatricopeptide repeat-containing protein n=1 Tax=Phaseolus angularis TaxID=3914 RepID=A0A0L9VUC2_PHAAN|nr:hypothetical protein LR48_Vigan11g172500 [Vigna angularis]